MKLLTRREFIISAAGFAAFEPLLGCSGPMPSLKRQKGRTIGPCVNDSERIYIGEPAAVSGLLVTLENVSGDSAFLRIIHQKSGDSAFLAIPRWGSQKLAISKRSLKIEAGDMSEGSPQWADLDIYSDC